VKRLTNAGSSSSQPKPTQEQLARLSGIGLHAYPVSVSWQPPFDMLLNEAQVEYHEDKAIAKWGIGQGGLAPFLQPSRVDLLIAALKTRPQSEVLVDSGAGLGFLSMAAAAAGRQVISWGHSSDNELFMWGIKANGMEKQIDLHEGVLHNGTRAHCIDSLEPAHSLAHESHHPFSSHHSLEDDVVACNATITSTPMDEALRKLSHSVDPVRVGALSITLGGQAGWMLDGAAATLATHPPAAVLIETSGEGLERAGYSISQLLNKMFKWGFVDVFHSGNICHERWEDVAHMDPSRHQNWTQWPPEGDRYWPMTRLPNWCRLCVGGNDRISDIDHFADKATTGWTANITETLLFFHSSMELMALGVEAQDTCRIR